MLVMVFTMLGVLAIAAGVIAVVVMGMEGTGRQQHPEIAQAMARTARHLNGEGAPPRALVQLFDEIDEVGELNVRDLPEKIRSLGSAATAASARSARSAWSALSARSAASANPPEGVVGLGDEPALDPVVDPEHGAEAEAQDESDVEAWAPSVAAPEASDVDESAAQQMSAALDAQVVDDPVEADPYGVLGAGDVAPAPDDTVVRVHLTQDEPRA